MSAQKIFLNAHNFNPSDVRFLAQDMSPRRYHRLSNKGYLLMESPPEVLESYAHVANILTKLGVRVPNIKAHDGERAIIEDWGDQTFTYLLQQGASESELYSRAMENLINLHKACFDQPHHASALSEYDAHTMIEEALLFPAWNSLEPLPEHALKDYHQIWHNLYQRCPPTPLVVVLRDYHVDNIMLTPQNEVGALDFQDALWGPCMYDVTSLLQDARVDVSSDVVSACLQQYQTAMELNENEWNDYITSYTIWGLGRHLKILGVFTRYAKKSSNTSKLTHIPRVWSYVDKIMENPLFGDLRLWMQRWDMKNPQG